MVAGEVWSVALANLVVAIRRGKLRGNYKSISICSLGHPFTDPFLRLFILIIVGCVDEVAERQWLDMSFSQSMDNLPSGFNESVHESKRSFLIHAAHEVFPSLSNAHGTKL